MIALVVACILLLVVSVMAFLASVSKKKMSLIYTALILFVLCVALSAFTIYRFLWAHVDKIG